VILADSPRSFGNRENPAPALVDLVSKSDVADVRTGSAVEVDAAAETSNVEHDDRGAHCRYGVSVDRRPEEYMPNVFGIERHERPLLLGQRIVQTQLNEKPILAAGPSSDRVKKRTASAQRCSNGLSDLSPALQMNEDGEEAVNGSTMRQPALAVKTIRSKKTSKTALFEVFDHV